MKFGKVDTVEGIDFTLPDFTIFNGNVFEPSAKHQELDIRVGCSVWSNKDYVGNLFPPKTSQKNYLKEYSKQFNTVEVNSTRYGMPKLSTLKTWHDNANDGFKFSFKMPQVVTHRKDINCDEAKVRLDQFFEGIYSIKEKVGTTFMLLPQYFGVQRKVELIEFIANLPNEFDATLEIRDPDLLKDKDIHHLLHEKDLSLCVTDVPGRRDVIHNTLTNNELFIRYAGSPSITVDEKRLKAWANRIVELYELGLRRIYFMIHQPSDQRGTALHVARVLGDDLNMHSDIQVKLPVSYAEQLLF